MSRALKVFHRTVAVVSAYLVLSGVSGATDRIGTLLEPAKFDIVINGVVKGSITAAKGTKVVILEESKELVLVGFSDSKTWLEKTHLEIPAVQTVTPSPTATPSITPSSSTTPIPKEPAAQSPAKDSSDTVTFRSGQPEHWITLEKDGRLLYAADVRGNRIPDFSNCGYEGGGVSLPAVPVKATVNPVQGDAGSTIQTAIDEVSSLPLDANGFRGAVLLHKGTYSIKDEIHINADGVILRGEGQDEKGTKIIATGNRQRTLIDIGSVGKGVKPRSEDDDTASGNSSASKFRSPITDSYVPVGAKKFNVGDASGLHVGDHVEVVRPSPQNWIHELGMDNIPQNKDGSVIQWSPGTYDLHFKRRITALQGNTVTIDAPICCALDKTYGGGDILAGVEEKTVRHVGIENLSGDSEFNGNTDEKHGWVFIGMVACRNGWVRDVTSIHFGYSCVLVDSGSTAITVQDCNCLDPISQITGGRRYSFGLDGQLCLVLRCHTRNGRHDFVMHARSPGPNAFVDCSADLAHADTGPHHRWSVGVLYDNVKVHGDGQRGHGEINIQNRGGMGTGHGWAGANQVLWNCVADGMIVQQPPTAQNWAIGCQAKTMEGNGYWESKGSQAQPTSLYRAQLSLRLGKEAANSVLGQGE